MKEDEIHEPVASIGKTTDSEPVPDAEHKPHEWPEADENYCSCCRARIIDGLTNVLQILTSPEKIKSLTGQTIGVDSKKPKNRAFLHAKCAERHFGMKVECDKCGVLCRAGVLSNGQKNTCKCTCHTGSNHCSLVLEPNYKNNRIVRELNDPKRIERRTKG